MDTLVVIWWGGGAVEMLQFALEGHSYREMEDGSYRYSLSLENLANG